MMKKLSKKRKGGFTLIELIVVIAIIGILAAILIPRFTGFQDRARRTQVVTDGKQIATAVESLIAEEAVPTGTTTAATDGTDEVIALSGVDLARITSLTYEDDGGFTLTSTVTNEAGTAYVASRADSDSPVQVNP